MFKVFYLYLTSRRFAIYVMTGMLCLFLLGILLPDPSVMPAERAARFASEHPYLTAIAGKLNIQHITSSWLFLTLPVFLFFSILLCTIQRIRFFFMAGITGTKPSSINLEEVASTDKTEMTLSTLVKFFKNQGWFCKMSNNTIIAGKGKYGFLGSVVFHLGMILIFIGIIISLLTGFSGSLRLIEGIRTGLDMQNFILITKRPRINTSLPEFFFTLENFVAKYDKVGIPLEYSCELLFEDEGMNLREKKISINQPLKYSGLSATLQRAGITPEFVIKDLNGKVVFDADVNLASSTDIYDMFNVHETGQTIYVKFYPDMAIINDMPMLKSREMKNPGFLLEVKDRNNRDIKHTFFLGMDARFGDYIIGVKGLKHWVELEISKDSGFKVMIAGFVFIILGLAVRFIDYDRRVFVKINERKVLLNGNARIFRDIFNEELDKLKNAIRRIV